MDVENQEDILLFQLIQLKIYSEQFSIPVNRSDDPWKNGMTLALIEDINGLTKDDKDGW